MEKLASRKLAAFVVAFVVFMVNGLLGAPLPEETVDQLLTALLGYLASQGLVDVAGAVSGKDGANIALGIVESLKGGTDDESATDETEADGS